jgi:hypothetical protein
MWITAGGGIIHIEDMTNTHLINSIRMLRTKHIQAIKILQCAMDGVPNDMSDSEDLEKKVMYKRLKSMESVKSEHPQYQELMDEAALRGLAIDPPPPDHPTVARVHEYPLPQVVN